MDFVLFVLVAVVGMAFALWYAATAALALLFDWAASPFLPSARRRREERRVAREAAKQERFEEFRARVQPTYEGHRRPIHDATNMREYRRLLRAEVRDARERAKRRRT